jgi:thiol-disulfide isomerase/thioredoxin
MKNISGALAAFCIALAVTGCGRSDSPATQAESIQKAQPEAADDAAPEGVAGDSIQWYEGSVDAAFKAALDQDKPLFLYWGAAWCPPCHQIKDQIFSRPEFIQKSRLFIPVYLDGDTERAQKYGDRFGVMGYPTMIVFRPDGRELTRIPGGLDIGLYANVLDLTLEGIRPVSDIVQAVLSDENVGEDDYRLLGFYSWSQDNDRALAGVDRVEAFRKMAETCPPDLEAASARLYAEYLRAALAADKDSENAYTMSDAQKQAALERVMLILSDEQLSKASLPLVISYSGDVVAGLTAADTAERELIVTAWNARLDALAADPETSVADRLWTQYVKLKFATLDTDEDVPESMAAEARAEVDQANTQAESVYQRQSFMNAAWYVLTASGQSEYARQLLLEELDKSKQPYYFMPSLAKLDEEAGDTQGALAWLKKGYETSEGPATRFQWGYYYVDGLIRLTPEDAETIAAATDQLLGELDGRQDAIYNRTGRIMKRLGARLSEWNIDGAYDEQIREIQSRVDSLCEDIPENDQALETCQVFMEEV